MFYINKNLNILLIIIFLFAVFQGCVSEKTDNSQIYYGNGKYVTGILSFPEFSDKTLVFSKDMQNIISRTNSSGNTFNTDFTNHRTNKYYAEKNTAFFRLMPCLNTISGFYSESENKIIISPVTSLIKNNVCINDVYAFINNSTNSGISLEDILKNPYEQFRYFDFNLPFSNELFKLSSINTSLYIFIRILESENIELRKEFLAEMKTQELLGEIYKAVSQINTKENMLEIYADIKNSIESVYFREKINFLPEDFVNGTFYWLYSNYELNQDISVEKIFESILYTYSERIKEKFSQNEIFTDIINDIRITGEKTDFLVSDYDYSALSYDNNGNIVKDGMCFTKPYISATSSIYTECLVKSEIAEENIEIYLWKDSVSILVPDNRISERTIKENIFSCNIDYRELISENGYYFIQIKKKSTTVSSFSSKFYLSAGNNNPPLINSCVVNPYFDTFEINVNITENSSDFLNYSAYLRKNSTEDWINIKNDYFSNLRNGDNIIRISTIDFLSDNSSQGQFKLRINNRFDSDEIIIEDLVFINNIAPEITSIRFPDGILSGTLDIEFDFISGDGEKTDLNYEYSFNGIDFNHISTNSVDNLSSGTIDFLWDSSENIRGVKDIFFRITPTDNDLEGIPMTIQKKVENSSLTDLVLIDYVPADIKIRLDENNSIHAVLAGNDINNPEKYTLEYFLIQNNEIIERSCFGFTDREDPDSGKYHLSWDFDIVNGVPVVFSKYNTDISVYRKNGVSWSTSTIRDFPSDEYGYGLSAKTQDNLIWLSFQAEIEQDEIIKKYIITGLYDPFSNVWRTGTGENYFKFELSGTKMLEFTDITLSPYNEPLLIFCEKLHPSDNFGTLFSVNLDSRLLEKNTISGNVMNALQHYDIQGDYKVFYKDISGNTFMTDINGTNLIDNSIENDFISAITDFNNKTYVYYADYATQYYVRNISDVTDILEINSENSVSVTLSSNVVLVNGVCHSIVLDSDKLKILKIY